MPPDDGNAANIGNQAVAVGGNLFAQQGHHHLADEIRGLLRLLGWRDASGGLGWDGFFCARQSPSRVELYAAGACCGCAAHQHDVTDQTAVALCGPVESEHSFQMAMADVRGNEHGGIERPAAAQGQCDFLGWTWLSNCPHNVVSQKKHIDAKSQQLSHRQLASVKPLLSIR